MSPNFWKNTSAKPWCKIDCINCHEIGSHLLVAANDEDQDSDKAYFKNEGFLT